MNNTAVAMIIGLDAMLLGGLMISWNLLDDIRFKKYWQKALDEHKAPMHSDLCKCDERQNYEQM